MSLQVEQGVCACAPSVCVCVCVCASEYKYVKCVFISVCCAVLSRFSHVRLFATLRTVARQAPQSVGFSRQEYWSGLPWPPPGDLPDPGIEPMSLVPPALAGGFFSTSAAWGAHIQFYVCLCVCACAYMCI